MTRYRRCTLPRAAAALLSLGLTLGPGIVMPPVIAQSPLVEPALLGAYKWRSIGPNRGGRSIAVLGVKGRPLEGYFGAVGGGLWKTADGGTTWAPVTDGLITSSSVGAVAVSDSNPDVLYIGHGRGVHPRQHHAWRWRLQVDRRGQDVVAHRLPRLGRDLADPHPPHQPRHRLRRQLRALRRCRARSAGCSRASTAARPGRRCSSATTRPAPWTSSSIAATRA